MKHRIRGKTASDDPPKSIHHRCTTLPYGPRTDRGAVAECSESHAPSTSRRPWAPLQPPRRRSSSQPSGSPDWLDAANGFDHFEDVKEVVAILDDELELVIRKPADETAQRLAVPAQSLMTVSPVALRVRVDGLWRVREEIALEIRGDGARGFHRDVQTGSPEPGGEGPDLPLEKRLPTRPPRARHPNSSPPPRDRLRGAARPRATTRYRACRTTSIADCSPRSE